MRNEIFTKREKEILESIGQPVQFQPRQIIYMEGDNADKILYIKKGRVRVYQSISSGKEVTLDVIGAGNITGESAFVSDRKRPTCIQAVTSVHVVILKVSQLLPYFAKSPEFALHFLQQSSNTMDRLCSRLHEQCLLDRYGKVASFILDLTETDSPENGTIDGTVPYTHEHLADSLGLSRTTVTAILKEFEAKKWISRGYGQVKITNRSALINFISEQKK